MSHRLPGGNRYYIVVRGYRLTRCRALAGCLALLVAWGACPREAIAQGTRPARVEDPFKRFRDADPEPAPLLPTETAWTLTLPSVPSAAAAMDDRRVYVPLRDARLVAIDREHGTLAWTRIIATAFPPLVHGGVVFALHGAALRALDTGTGADRWATVLDAPPILPLAAAGERLLIAIESGELLAVHAASGVTAWRQPLPVAPRFAPVTQGTTAYVTLSDNRLLALSLADGSILWERPVPGTLSPPAVVGDRVYVGSTDNALHAFDAVNGRPRWRMPGGGDVLGAAPADDRIFYVSLDNIVRALNQGNGNQRWREETGTRPTFPPLAFGGLVVVPGVAPAATVFNARTGAQIGTIAVSQGTLLGPPLIDEALPPYRTSVVMLTREGVLEAFRSVPLQFREAAPAALPALPGRVIPREVLR
jgi:outer membrane protein assembly factor BamB